MNSAATNERIWNPRRGHIFRKTDGALASFWDPLCYRYKYYNHGIIKLSGPFVSWVVSEFNEPLYAMLS